MIARITGWNTSRQIRMWCATRRSSDQVEYSSRWFLQKCSNGKSRSVVAASSAIWMSSTSVRFTPSLRASGWPKLVFPEPLAPPTSSTTKSDAGSPIGSA